MHTDGTYVGRAAPEIDMLEAQVSGFPGVGQVSQSAQWAVSGHHLRIFFARLKPISRSIIHTTGIIQVLT